MICYHHTDMDGKTAGYLVHSMKPKEIIDYPSSYIMTNYGDNFDKHTDKDDVFVVDISISDTDYDKFINLCKTARTVTWIDHHATSTETIKKHYDELQAIKNLTYFVSECACGAALVYSFFKIPYEDLKFIRGTEDNEVYQISAKYENGEILVNLTKGNKKNIVDTVWRSTLVKLPKWLFHVDDYDCWKKQDPDSERFALAFDSMNTDIGILDNRTGVQVFNNNWSGIDAGNVGALGMVSQGKFIQDYVLRRYDNELDSTFEWEYDKTKFICKNATGNSWNFRDLIDRYDAAILFHYDGRRGKWEYSVYSSNASGFDCCKFCQGFGGGGHLHASGFQTEQLIFTNPPKKDERVLDHVFLGGTWNQDFWRKDFIKEWKKRDDKKIKHIKLFDPIVEDWDKDCIAKENDIKKNHAAVNLFVVTPRQSGAYTFAEVIEACHYSKVVFIIYDPENEIEASAMGSYNAIGQLVEEHGGTYKAYKGLDTMHMIVSDVIEAL